MTADARVLQYGPWAIVAWAVVAVTPVVFGWATVTTLAGPLPPATGVAVGVGTATVLVTLLLVHLALALPHGPCRGAGFLGMGVLASGAGTIALLVAPPGLQARWLTLSFTASAALYLLGLLLLPGTTATWRARLRRVLDGAGVGIGLFFAGWLLIIVPLAGAGPGPAGPRALTAVVVWLVAAMAASAATLTVVRAFRYRRSALLCGGGVVSSMIGQALLIMLVLVHAAPSLLFGAAGVVTLGPLLVWLGAQRAGVRTDQPHPAVESVTFAGLPLLTVPVLLAVVGCVYHLATARSFGTYSAGLGVLMVVAVAAREIFAVFDVRDYAAELVGQESRFRAIVAGSHDVTMVLDDNLIVGWQSPAAARQFGLSDAEVLGRGFTLLFHPEDASSVAEALRGLLLDPPDRPVLLAGRIRDGFGGWRHTESTATDHRSDPAVSGVVIHLRDVGERRTMEARLHRMSHADPLTGLPNRRAILRALTELRDRTGADTWRGSVLLIDLDGLSAVNDGRGHDIGDAVLIEVAQRLRDQVRSDHLVARLGGDEFAVLSGDSPAAAQGTARRLLTALGEPFEPPGGRVFLSASIGIAEFSPGATGDELLAGADLAMRRAHQLGRNRIERYDESLEMQLMRRGLLEGELRGAGKRGEFDLAFHPVVTVADRRPVGAEALLRWRHPQLGMVPPAEFIPIAEQAGMIGDIGGWVLHQAARRLRGWLDDGRELSISVNLSAAQLYHPDLVSEVAAVLDAHQVPAERFVVEVAENAVVDDITRAIGTLAELRALGVRTALDDFGTGHAALTYLRRLPLDILKVGRALISDPGRHGTPAAPLADVVVPLGDRLGIAVIAEGVETEAQLALLREAGCGYAQGYLFSKPLAAEHAEAFFDRP